MSESAGFIEQAKQVRETFERDAADVTSRGFTEDVEKAQVADLYLEAQQKVTALREQHRLAEVREESDAARKVYGAEDLRSNGTDPSTHQVSYRDAQDRAETTDNEAALLTLMKRADRSGDRLLARACAARAVQRNWTEAQAFYEDRNPGFGALAQQAREQRQAVSVARALWFRLPKPSQVQGMSDLAMTRHRDRVGEQLAAQQAERSKRTAHRGTLGILG